MLIFFIFAFQNTQAVPRESKCPTVLIDFFVIVGLPDGR